MVGGLLGTECYVMFMSVVGIASFRYDPTVDYVFGVGCVWLLCNFSVVLTVCLV